MRLNDHYIVKQLNKSKSYTVKILLLGDKNIGKSCLIQKIINPLVRMIEIE